LSFCERFWQKSIEKLKRTKVVGHAKTYNFHKNYYGIPRVSQSYFKIPIFAKPGLGKTGAKN
jgi:hypothetical protein